MAADDFYLAKRGSSAIPNQTIWDKELSLPALTLLLLASAVPPGTPMGYEFFTKLDRGYGRPTVQKALRELNDRGYRWQFTVRRGGRVRTITMVSPEPISENDALIEFEEMRRNPRTSFTFDFIIACINTGTKYNQPKRDKATPESVSAGHPGLQVSVVHKPVPQENASTGLQVSDTHKPVVPLRSSAKSSSLRSELLTNQPDPPEVGWLVEDDPDLSDGVISEGPPESGTTPRRASLPPGSGTEQPYSNDQIAAGAALVATCLPRHLGQGMDRQGIGRVAALLQERLDAGWRKGEIRAAMDQPLPPGGTTRLAGLVAYRLTANVDPALSPAASRQAAAERQQGDTADTVKQRAKQAWAKVWAPEFHRVRRSSKDLDPSVWEQHAATALAARGLTEDVFTAQWIDLASSNPAWTPPEITDATIGLCEKGVSHA